MRLKGFAFPLLLTLALAGCINSSTVLHVKTDGSGTIEQTIAMNTAALKGLIPGDAQAQVKQAPVFGEEEFKKAAATMGNGVRFVSSTPTKVGGWEGSKAMFAFDDISQLRVSQDPNVGSAAGMPMARGQSSPVTFKFARQGASSLLTVTFDESAIKAPPAVQAQAQATNGQAPGVDPAMMTMLKQVFQGFKVAMNLEVEGAIVKTNADYVTGSRITLLEIEMDNLLQDEAKLRALQGKVGTSIAEIRPYLKDVKGVKINQPVITVEFR